MKRVKRFNENLRKHTIIILVTVCDGSANVHVSVIGDTTINVVADAFGGASDDLSL